MDLTSQDDAYPPYSSPETVPRTQIIGSQMRPTATHRPAPSLSPAPDPRARHRPARTSLHSPCQTHWVVSSFLRTTLAAVAGPPLQGHPSPYFSFYRKHLASPLPKQGRSSTKRQRNPSRAPARGVPLGLGCCVPISPRRECRRREAPLGR